MLLELDYEQAQGRGVEDAVFLSLDKASTLAMILWEQAQSSLRLEDNHQQQVIGWCNRPLIATLLRRLLPGFDTPLPRLPDRHYYHLRIDRGILRLSVFRAHDGGTGVTAETAPLAYRFSEGR